MSLSISRVLRPLLTLLLFTAHLSAYEMPPERAEVLRLQIYLDQQNFGPGVLDGKMGTFTEKAIAAYNKKFGRKDSEWDLIKVEAQQSIPNLYATAIVPDVVTKLVDPEFKYGNDREYQAARRDMPYRSVAELMAERYHTTPELLSLINKPGAVRNATARTALIVPNIEPFRIEDLAQGRSHRKAPVLSQRWAVIDTKENQIRIYDPVETVVAPAADDPLAEPQPHEHLPEFDPTAEPVLVEISTSRAIIIEDDPEIQQTLSPYDEHRALLVAAYPITPGKPEFIRYGTWKMMNAVEFPTWRYDASLLETGERSNKSLQIPSGPNNPVGVIWMGLSRRGIGIHGTSAPATIGRGLSAGCIRLANWDAVKLPTFIRPGATVIIK